MTTYDERNNLAPRAEIDQRFAQIDQKFVDLQRDILAGVDARLVAFEDRFETKLAGLESKIDGAVRFNRGTLWSVAVTIAASVIAAGATVALAIAFG